MLGVYVVVSLWDLLNLLISHAPIDSFESSKICENSFSLLVRVLWRPTAALTHDLYFPGLGLTGIQLEFCEGVLAIVGGELEFSGGRLVIICGQLSLLLWPT